MDTDESDAVMLEVLGEMRRLRCVLTNIADTMVVVNQTCVRVMEAVERLDARVTLLQAAP